MKLNIKKFENPSGNILKLNTAIDEAYDFYHNDVEARKERERSWLLQLYTIKTPIEKTYINIDNNQGIGLGTSFGDDFVGEWRYNKGIYLNPNIIFKKYYNKDRLSRAITHELSHEDAYLKRPKDYAIDEYIAPLVLENITIKEKKYLDKAYKTDANTPSKNIEEKHATNRLLRHQLYLNFIKVNGRKPNSIEELDDFIRNTSDMSIMYLLRDLNDYGYDYFYNKNTDPKAIKDALIHVALNDTDVVLYAKKGCNIKKYQTPSEPLNKNYPEEVMKYWWLGDYEGFKKAKLNYDNYYGKILPESKIIASKTKPIKTSDWTSEHNIIEDNKKYEQAHQAESLKIANAVSNKMNKVGNAIGTTAVELGSSFTPLWWAYPAVKSGLDISKGDYKSAAINIGLGLVTPYALGKYVIPGVSKGMSYLDDVAIKNIKPYRNYRITKEFSKGVGNTEAPYANKSLENLKLVIGKNLPDTPYNQNNILYLQPKTNSEKTYLGLLEKPSKLTEAERLGLPKGERYTYMNLEDLNLFKNKVNEFAKSNKYPTFDKVEFSLHELERFARDMINRHNSFYRGVLMPWKKSDLEIIYNKLGPNATQEEILQYVATHPKSNPGTMFITPHPTNGYGHQAIIQRPYKLGNNRLKWIEEGDFVIRNGNIERDLPNDKLHIINPWNETGKPNSYINDELLATQPMIFRRWANPDATQLSNNLKNFKQGGSIHIKEKNKGKFTEAAKRAGKSVQEHARDVVNNPKATKLQKKRALFALNAKKFKHD